MLSEGQRLAAIVTTGEADTLAEVVRAASDAARAGVAVRVFFRDESIPAICKPEVAAHVRPSSEASRRSDVATERALQELVDSGDVKLYACSSSLYVWGVEARDLIAPITGARGLIAFLAEDLAGAGQVLTY